MGFSTLFPRQRSAQLYHVFISSLCATRDSRVIMRFVIICNGNYKLVLGNRALSNRFEQLLESCRASTPNDIFSKINYNLQHTHVRTWCVRTGTVDRVDNKRLWRRTDAHVRASRSRLCVACVCVCGGLCRVKQILVQCVCVSCAELSYSI